MNTDLIIENDIVRRYDGDMTEILIPEGVKKSEIVHLKRKTTYKSGFLFRKKTRDQLDYSSHYFQNQESDVCRLERNKYFHPTQH